MENADFFMAMGVANALPEALQAATTSLAEWIEREYKLTANETALVIGSSIRYDVAETQKAMRAAKLPQSLATRLATGT